MNTKTNTARKAVCRIMKTRCVNFTSNEREKFRLRQFFKISIFNVKALAAILSCSGDRILVLVSLVPTPPSERRTDLASGVYDTPESVWLHVDPATFRPLE